MKKFLILFMTLILSLCLFVGCKSTPNPSGENADSQQDTEAEKPESGDEGETDDELSPPEDDRGGSDENQKEITMMYLTINGNKLAVSLAQNSSVEALIELLKQSDIVYTADDYGGFEKVGNIGHTLPRNDTQITTVAGDVILYQGNQICLFVGSNSWSYTRIGKINYSSQSELESFLGAGNGRIEVRISLK